MNKHERAWKKIVYLIFLFNSTEQHLDYGIQSEDSNSRVFFHHRWHSRLYSQNIQRLFRSYNIMTVEGIGLLAKCLPKRGTRESLHPYFRPKISPKSCSQPRPKSTKYSMSPRWQCVLMFWFFYLMLLGGNWYRIWMLQIDHGLSQEWLSLINTVNHNLAVSEWLFTYSMSHKSHNSVV